MNAYFKDLKKISAYFWDFKKNMLKKIQLKWILKTGFLEKLIEIWNTFFFNIQVLIKKRSFIFEIW